MKKIIRIILNPKKFFLYSIIYVLLGLSNIMIKLVTFKTLISFLTNSNTECYEQLSEKTLNRVHMISRSIISISNKTPWRSMCFEQAITANIILRALGISNTIYFGIRKNEENKLEAHAWTRVDNTYVTGKNTMALFKPVLIKSYITKKSKSRL